MKTRKFIPILFAISLLGMALGIKGCAKDENSPLEEAKIIYTPNDGPHTPYLGCDSLVAPLYSPRIGPQFKFGTAFFIQNKTQLAVVVKPNPGLLIQDIELHAGVEKLDFPLVDDIPDFSSFDFRETYEFGTRKHVFDIQLDELRKCQWYSMHATIFLKRHDGTIAWTENVWVFNEGAPGDGSGSSSSSDESSDDISDDSSSDDPTVSSGDPGNSWLLDWDINGKDGDGYVNRICMPDCGNVISF